MKNVKIPWTHEKVGPRILEIISEGLFPNRLDIVREYIQNSLDENAKKVEIKIKGNDLIIFDDGEGMDINGIESFTDIGKSIKILDENTSTQGFRGIGTYSALKFSDTIDVDTIKEDVGKKYHLNIDCKNIRRNWEDNKTNALSLLENNIILEEKDDSKNMHYTNVILKNFIPNENKEKFEEELKNYLGQTLPVPYPKTFEKKNEIDEFRKSIPGWKTVQIYIDDVQIYKPCATNLGNFIPVNIEDDKNNLIGKIWYSITRKGSIENEYARGLIYVWRGFSIGDRTLPKRHARRFHDARYFCCTGEIYVFDNDYYKPNAARDEFTADFKKYFQPFVQIELRKLENEVKRRQEKSEAKKYAQKDIDNIERIIRTLNTIDKRNKEYKSTVVEFDREINNLRKRYRALKDEDEIGKIVKTKLEKAEKYRETITVDETDIKKWETKIKKQISKTKKDYDHILKSTNIPKQTAKLLNNIRNILNEEIGSKKEEYSRILEKIIEEIRKTYKI